MVNFFVIYYFSFSISSPKFYLFLRFFFSSGQHSLAELQQKLAQLTFSQQQQQPIAQPGLTSTIQQLENNTLNLQVRNSIRVVILIYQ
jgi:DNA recombination-dependent growth factor C